MSIPPIPFPPFTTNPEPLVRRMVWWFFVAGLLPLLLMVILAWIGIDQWNQVWQLWPLYCFTWGLALYVATVRFRVDEHGIWNRHFFWWRGWNWQRFLKKDIVLAGNTYRDLQSPWWECDRISLTPFPDAVREEVTQYIHLFWNPPAIPDKFELRALWSWKKEGDTSWRMPSLFPVRVTLSANHILIERKFPSKVMDQEIVEWEAVEKVELIRERSRDALPVMMFVYLTGMADPIYFRLDSSNLKLDIEAIQEQTGRWCKLGRFQQLAQEGEIVSEAEAIYRIKHHTKHLRDSWKVQVWMPTVFLILISMLLFQFLDRPFAPLFWDWVGFCLVIFMLFGLLSVVLVIAGLHIRRHRHNCQLAERFLALSASKSQCPN